MTDTLPDANNPAGPAGEGAEEYDFESLLKEHDEGVKRPAPAKPDPTVLALLKEMKPLAEFADQARRTEAQKQETEVVQSAITTVKEEGDLSNVPDTIVEAYLNLQYIKNPEFKAAFDGRGTSPTNWTNALVKARESLGSDIKAMSSSSSKDDTEAALATVRGTSQTEIEKEAAIKPKDLFAMSEQDFEAFKQNLG